MASPLPSYLDREAWADEGWDLGKAKDLEVGEAAEGIGNAPLEPRVQVEEGRDLVRLRRLASRCSLCQLSTWQATGGLEKLFLKSSRQICHLSGSLCW